MAKVAVMTDSNSGITQKEAKELGVYVVPMPFFIDGELYLEDITLTREQFFERLMNDCDISRGCDRTLGGGIKGARFYCLYSNVQRPEWFLPDGSHAGGGL